MNVSFMLDKHLNNLWDFTYFFTKGTLEKEDWKDIFEPVRITKFRTQRFAESKLRKFNYYTVK